MKKIIVGFLCSFFIALVPLVIQANTSEAQKAVQQGLADQLGLEAILNMLMGDPHNMSLGDATLLAMEAGGDPNSMGFMSTGLDMACEDSNAHIAIVTQQLVQTFGAESVQALEARSALDKCQPSIYQDDFSTGGIGSDDIGQINGGGTDGGGTDVTPSL